MNQDTIWPPPIEDNCRRCECGLGEHSCWRYVVQQLPPLQAKRPNPVKVNRAKP